MEDPTHRFIKNRLSVLMPVYNERAFLRQCIKNIFAVNLPENLELEIIIVDDGSTDGTRDLIMELAKECPEIIKPFFQEKNQGKGAAIRRAVQEMSGEYAIIQDADLEYDPSDYDLLLQPLLEGLADVVYGSRFASRRMRRVLLYHHALGNKFLTHLSNFTTGLDLTDMETCYKAFRADVLKTIPLRSNRFGIEPEITAKISKRGCSVYEVPISYRGRGYAEGKKIGWRDGVAAIFTILKYWVIDDCFYGEYGHSILHSISKARRFNKWIADIIAPYLGQEIFEVGSGIGNVSKYLPKLTKLVVSDLEEKYLNILENSFADNEIVSVQKLDLNCREDFANIGTQKFDSVVCLNILEHIEDDVEALKRMRDLLKNKGRLIIQVPQYENLYGSYDRVVGHYRRYTKKKLAEALCQSGFQVKTFINFNFLAIPGWWVNACFFKKNEMSKIQLKIFDMLVPFSRFFEKVLPLPGLSLICVAERTPEL